PGLEQLGAKEHRVDAAEEEHEQRERQVHRADVLVVRRVDPATPARQGMVVVVMRVVVWVQYGAHFVLLPRFRLPCLDSRFSAAGLCGWRHARGRVGPVRRFFRAPASVPSSVSRLALQRAAAGVLGCTGRPGESLLHAWRVQVITDASSTPPSCANEAMAVPCLPLQTTTIRAATSPLTTSEPSSAGNVPGTPWPLAWWQAAQLAA